MDKISLNPECYHFMPEIIQQELKSLFVEHRVLDIELLRRHFVGRSSISLRRDLKEAKSLSSYSHAGKYYTLRRIAKFDVRGLWHYDNIGFSQHHTLRNTVAYLVDMSTSGYTYAELKEEFVVRMDNVLRELVEDKLLRREGNARQYLYLSADNQRAAKQKEQRAQLQREALLPLSEGIIIEVLAEVIRGHRICIKVEELTARLVGRGVKINAHQTALILDLYAVKKTLGSN